MIEGHNVKGLIQFTFLILFLPLLVHPCVPKQDCTPPIPESLRAALAKRYPDHRILGLKDMNVKTGDARLYKEKFADKCPSIATGDFDGNGTMDYGLYLCDEKNRRCILIAALRQQGKWSLEVLCSYHECCLPGSAYLETLNPGRYESMLANELTPKDIAEGNVARHTSKTPGIYFGALETEGTAYFRKGNEWVKLEF